MLLFVYGSSDINILHLPFFRSGKYPLEDLIYTSCTDPIQQPAAARTPRLYTSPRLCQSLVLRLLTLVMSLFDLQDVYIVIGSLATLDLPMVVDLIGIYVLKGPYCTLTTTDWFLQALSVIPRGSWGDVAVGAWLRPVSRGNRHFTVGGGRLRQSGPRPEGRLLRQTALEGLTRSTWMDSPRKVGRNKFRRGAAAAAAILGRGEGRRPKLRS
ncbi:hypothetical protein F511_18092 [Dorcoceras hygrometricum]|uniref:Uncharacterized protein n=1 Tax=Dorcoceras hygrometricum TaxID=472368 RepID=A0A2Z7BRB7_9LAMI|nr:hypothetical protein F511_18092 [Dorcoceras hygrometricum]